MRSMIPVVALLALSGCAVQQGGDGDSRKVRQGFFYAFFTPPPDQDRGSMERRLEKQGAPSPLPPFGEARIPPRRSHGATPEDSELRDWKDAVLANADETLLRQIHKISVARVEALEAKIAGLEKSPYAMRPGRVEDLRHELDLERRKRSEIEWRLGAE